MRSSEKERLIKLDILSIENRLRHAFNQGYDLGYKQGIEKSKKQLKIGHWVDKNVRGSVEPYCSVCGDSIDSNYHYNYCPNCGAKMVESQESEEEIWQI